MKQQRNKTECVDASPPVDRARRAAGQDGRDHWPGCFTSMLAGGGASGHMVYGQSGKHSIESD